jgi:cold shock CspA family protein
MPRNVTSMNGEIVWYSSTKRYGFVRPSEGGAELVFCLDAAGEAALAPVTRGMAVHFMVRQGGDGPEAHHVSSGHMEDDSL